MRITNKLKRKRKRHIAKTTDLTEVLGSSMRLRKELEGLFRVLEISNRVVVGRNLNLTVVGKGSLHARALVLPNAPAWTDGEDIWVNGDAALDWKDRVTQADGLRSFVASLKGLNYHELAHTIFTPRVKDPLSIWVVARGRELSAEPQFWWCYNALEDQRAEMMFGAEYSLAYEYFKHSNLTYIMREPQQQFDQLLPLQHGRLFLPTDLRTRLKKLFADAHGEDEADIVTDVIDEYITLVHDRQSINPRAKVLIEALYDVLYPTTYKSEPKPVSSHYVPPGGDVVGEENQLNKGESESGEDVSDEVARLVAEDVEDREEIEAGGGGAGGEGEDEPSEDDEAGEGTGTEEDEESEGPTFDERNPNEGRTVPGSKAELIDDIKESAEKLIEDGMSSARITDDLTRTIKAAHAQKSAGLEDPKFQKDNSHWPVTQDMKLSKQRLVPVLREIKLDLEAHWMKHQESGRLDPYAAMVSEASTFDLDVFDRWDEGAEAEGGVEVVLVIDQSGSMGGEQSAMQRTASGALRPAHGGQPRWTDGAIVPASQAVWVLCSAFAEVDIRVTVLGFQGRQHRVLVGTNERVKTDEYALFNSAGGTAPQAVLSEAWSILRDSEHRNRLLCVATDGRWDAQKADDPDLNRGWRSGNNDSIIESMNLEGIHTTLLGMDHAETNFGSHNCQTAGDIESPMEIVVVMGEAVKAIMTDAAFLHID